MFRIGRYSRSLNYLMLVKTFDAAKSRSFRHLSPTQPRTYRNEANRKEKKNRRNATTTTREAGKRVFAVKWKLILFPTLSKKVLRIKYGWKLCSLRFVFCNFVNEDSQIFKNSMHPIFLSWKIVCRIIQFSFRRNCFPDVINSFFNTSSLLTFFHFFVLSINRSIFNRTRRNYFLIILHQKKSNNRIQKSEILNRVNFDWKLDTSSFAIWLLAEIKEWIALVCLIV